MNDKTDQLIASLAATATPQPPVRLRNLCIRSMAAFALYAAVLIACSGVRPDLATAASNPLFVIEILLLVALVMSAALSATLAAFPDHHQYNKLLWLPVVLLLAFGGVLAAELLVNPSDVVPSGHGPECLSCISLYALLPGAYLLVTMRRLASTRPGFAGATALLESFSLGALALLIKEATDYMPHLIQWHYLPMLVVALIGVALGRMLLRW